MPVQPFTPSGVDLKVSELYALPDNQLFLEADQIRDSFINWVNGNFSLTNDQSGYLNQMDVQFRDYLAQQLSVGVRFRIPIVLQVVGIIGNITSKRFWIKVDWGTSWKPNAQVANEGTGITLIAAYPEEEQSR